MKITDDGTRIIYAPRPEKYIYVLSFQMKDIIHKFEQDKVRTIALSDDSQYLVAGTQTHKVLVWNLKTMELLNKFEEPTDDWVLGLAFTSDGLLMSGSYEGNICVWNFKKEEKNALVQSFKIDETQPFFVIVDNRMLYGGQNGVKVLNYKELKEDPDNKEPQTGQKIFDENHQFLRTTKDGNHLILLTNQRIEVWNTSSLSLEYGQNFPSKPFRKHFAITPDSKRIICIVSHSCIEIWNLEDNTFVHGFEKNNMKIICCVAVSRDGKTLVSGDNTGSISIWNLETLEYDSVITSDHIGSIFDISISHDDTKIVSLTSKAVSIWDLSTRKWTHSCDAGRYESFTCMALSKVSNRLVVGTYEGSLRVFDIGTEEKTYEIKDSHTKSVISTVLTSDDKFLISGSDDHTIAVRNLKSQDLVYRFNQVHKASITTITVDDYGKYMFAASSDGTICVFDLLRMKIVHKEKNVHQMTISHIAVTPNGKYLVSVAEDYTIGLFQLKEDVLCSEIQTDQGYRIDALIVSRDNRFLVTCSWDKSIAVFDLYQKKKLCLFENAHDESIRSLSITDDSKYLISTSYDKKMGVWDLKEMKPHHKFSEFQQTTTYAEAFPDCRTAACGSIDGSIAVFDIEDKKTLYKFGAHKDGVLAVRTTRDGAYIVSGGYDSTVAVWSHKSADHHLIRRLKLPKDDEVPWYLGITNDSQRIIAWGATLLRVWRFDQDDNDPPEELKYEQSKEISAVVFSYDTRYLVISSSEDCSIVIWDLQKKNWFFRMTDPRFKQIGDIAISSDLRHIFCILQDQRSIGIIKSSFISNANDPEKQKDRVVTLNAIDCYLNPQGFSSDEMKDAMKVLVNFYFLPEGWDYLHFVAFQLPDVDTAFIDIANAEENKITLSFDKQNKTPLDYMIEYEGKRNMRVQKFFAYFFKNISSFISFKGLDSEKMLQSLSSQIAGIMKTQTESSFLKFLSCLQLDAAEHLRNYKKLQSQGVIIGEKNRVFIPLKALEYNKEAKDIIIKGNNTINYSIIGLRSSYDIYSRDSLDLIQMLNDSPNVSFYESPVVRNLIDFYWQKSMKYQWWWLAFNSIPVALFTAFAILRTDYEHAASGLLAGTIAINTLLLFFEILQIISSLSEYAENPFNFIELVIISFQFVTAGLFWGDIQVDIVSFFVSLSLLLWYTKLLILLRIIDQLRELIRMIIEIMAGALSFMTVIFTYVVGFTIAMYQSRRASETTDLSFWSVALEMYTFGIGSYDGSNYSGVTMPFFILASILMPLILLNMLIALMGDIYGKANEKAVAVNARERIAMISEISSTVIQLRKIFKLITRRTAENAPQKYFILIAEPFEANEESVTVETLIGDQSTRIKDQSTKIEDQSTKIENQSTKIEDQSKKIEDMQNQLTRVESEFKIFKTELKTELSELAGLVKKALKAEDEIKVLKADDEIKVLKADDEIKV